MATRFRIAEQGDVALFDRIADGVFDGSVRPDLLSEFLSDVRHHLAIATMGDEIVGMASGVDYVHPDKPRELWINEVGIAPSHQRQGLGTRVVRTLLDYGRHIGCGEAWVLSADDEGVRKFYRSLGGQETGTHHTMFTFGLK